MKMYIKGLRSLQTYKQSITIIVLYIFAQFSGGLFGFQLLMAAGISKEQVIGIWAAFIFTILLGLVVYLYREEIKFRHHTPGRSTKSEAMQWAILGIFIAFAAQIVVGIIEMRVFKIPVESENTEMIMEIVRLSPLFIIYVTIVGPIWEEIIFRKIIFGGLYQRTNFWIATIISSTMFAAIHMDFLHILKYTAIGITFAFLYVKTKRILVPIVAHIALNSFVVILQFAITPEQIKKMQEQLEQTQSFIGGLFL